jgi:hypothetical protein
VTILVQPNPAAEGQPVTITVDGPGPYEWGVFGHGTQTLPVDPETGRAQVTLPAGSAGGVLVVTDGESDSTAVNIDTG